jgi:N-sulfoglucosamine sulfohydrolase
MKYTICIVGLFMLSVRVNAAEPRPNILFCFADDWGRYASAYALHEKGPSPNRVVKTPNIDRVAAQGAIFKNAFVNSPSCTPCRSALLSGRYFYNCGRGAILNGAVWDDAIPSFPLLMQNAGYHIGKTAKVWSPGTPTDAPFGQQKHAFQKSGMRFNNFSEEATSAIAKGKALEAIRDELLTEVRGNFEAFLDAKQSDKPFLYWFGPTNTHRMWVKGSGKLLWKIDPDSLKGNMPANLPDVPEVREDFADYLGEVHAYDAYIGVLLKVLDERKLHEQTAIVISGDHGAPGFPGGKCNLYDFGVGVSLVASLPGGKGGRVIDDFVNLMDLCPTFLEMGGVKLPAGLNGRSLLNVLQSQASGQIDPSRTFVVCGRERHVADAREGNLPYPQRSLRTKDFLYIRNFEPDRYPMGDPRNITDDKVPSSKDLETSTYASYSDMDASPTKAWLIANRNDPKWKRHYEYAFAKRPGEEFFEIASDPHQMQNVANDPKWIDRKNEMAKRLMVILNETGDPRVVEKECRFEKAPYTDANPAKKKKQ